MARNISRSPDEVVLEGGPLDGRRLKGIISDRIELTDDDGQHVYDRSSDLVDDGGGVWCQVFRFVETREKIDDKSSMT